MTNLVLVGEISEGLSEQIASEQVGLVQADWEQAVDLEQACLEQAQWDQQGWLGQVDLEQVHWDQLGQNLQEWDLHYHLDQGFQEQALVDLPFLGSFKLLNLTYLKIYIHPFSSLFLLLYSLDSTRLAEMT